MQKLRAIVTLIRLPNLVFIFLTQWLAWYSMILPVLKNTSMSVFVLSYPMLGLLSFSTVLIAAAGYMINDYFDIGIDVINKPERVTIEKIFKRRTIISWHILLNVFALLMAGYVAYHFLQLRYLGLQLLCIFLLLVYSTTFKRKLIIGNLIIAVLTALSLLTIAMYEPAFPLFQPRIDLVQMYWFYILFAFLITFIREVIKDIEDIKGDDAQHCKTIPLVWGIQAAKKFVYTLVGILMVSLLMITYTRFLQNPAAASIMSLLCLSLVFVCYKVYLSTNTFHFHLVSTYLKWITLFGILSMFFHSCSH